MSADAEKKQRKTAKSNFTRHVKKLNLLLDQGVSQVDIVTAEFVKMNAYYEALENAQLEFLEKSDIDIDTDPDGSAYMVQCDTTHAAAVVKYSTFLKKEKDEQLIAEKTAKEEKEKKDKDDQKALEDEMKTAELTKLNEERKERFESEKARLTSCISSFKRMTIAVTENLTEVSVVDRRLELGKVEAEFSSLKDRVVELAGIDPTQDIEDIKGVFEKDAQDVFLSAQKDILTSLKDEPSTSGGDATTSGGSTTSSRSGNLIRHEKVVLPSFEGDESKSPFLKFPTWKKQWLTMIKTFDPDYRDVTLMRHLDETAQGKIVGYETMYEEAFQRLCDFYGDPLKIIQCVMDEVTSPDDISEGDYQSLINYSVVLEDNFNRLTAMGTEYQKEMSNSQAMASILRKFPRLVGEQWYDYLGHQDSAKKSNVFPVLIDWLKSRRSTWEGMASVDVRKTTNAFFGQQSMRKCFQCGSDGHVKKDCPFSQQQQQLQQQLQQQQQQLQQLQLQLPQHQGALPAASKKKRNPPTVKKFWCALHKDHPTRRCYSDSCQELKLVDTAERVQLLQNNGDCFHCCGDHLPADCNRKERVCGGNKDDRGCKKSHTVHELFCLEAKVFSVQHVHSTSTSNEGVLLLIMQVVISAESSKKASVFYDYGCTANFIREEFAKNLGFKGKVENLSVVTLGGKVSQYVSVMTYTCSMITVDGETVEFQAYGMESITGPVTGMGFSTIQRLFPHLPDETIKTLERQPEVDILIGAAHVSWHPQRVERASGGGDFWIFRGLFGSCLGGRHPEVKEATQKNKNLFVSVHKNFHITTFSEPCSHELEFCPDRCEKYFHSSIVDLPRESPTVAVETHEIREDESLVEQLFPSNDSILTVDLPSETSTIALETGTVPMVGAENILSPESSTSTNSVHYRCDEISDPTEMCLAVKASALTDEDLFFKSQAIGTVVKPTCGGCSCGNCSIPGMKYSFKEQQEYDAIQRNLVYNENEKRYYTEYPWKTDRSALPRNDKEALKLLLSVERMLLKDPHRLDGYCKQIESMVERGAAVELSAEQREAWEGDYYYLPILGVLKKDEWRLVFDAARRQCGHPSMNECIMKGPHRFMNDLGSVLLGFRNGRVAAVADLRKFHNQVYLDEKDIHMQRFLWRNMNLDQPPKHMAVTVNNFGVTAANCIATSALHRSAEHFRDIYPHESEYLKEQIYIDDELVAADNVSELQTLTSRLDEICDHAGMHNKGWTFSGQKDATDIEIGMQEGEKVLGMSYCPSTDTFFFKVTLKLKTITNGDILVSTAAELKPYVEDLVLTRRVLLSNVARIFDPLGCVSPVLLQAKVLMRESWCGTKIGWDDPLPPEQHHDWINFLFALLSLGSLTFARSLWPQEEVVGLPSLVIFSDGSVQAFGATAYIHWKLKSGGYWSRLIMSKSKIAPKNMISVPRMELNGTVIGTRMRNFLLKETNLKFENVIHLVDSSTVLGYIQKECGSFQPYEGVRIAEIQTSIKISEDRIVKFAWVASQDNPSDWCTKPQPTKNIQLSFWTEGPEFLKLPVSSWPLKYTYKKDNLEGQLHLPKQIKCLFVQAHHEDFLARVINRSSSWTKSVRVLAWILRFTNSMWFRYWRQRPLDADELKRARTLLIKFAQRELIPELQSAAGKGKGKFRKLAPVEDDQGVWRVGSRMRVVPFTLDARLPALLPTNHRVTLLIMRNAHQHSHLAQDGTSARFRAIGFWTNRCGHLAKRVYENCVTCRKLNQKTLQQRMGEIPEERLTEPYAWGYCQMDLFGPFMCRSDVYSRASKKTWGMIIEDTNSGAVHLDVVQDYSAQAVILSLRRFGSLRGWPGVISSDPGSQLESAGGKLEEWWTKLGDSLLTFAGTKNFEWKISPGNSPWRQGKVERKIAIVKRLITLSVGETRITPLELQTVLFEIGNICNERPIGSAVPRADGSYSLVTPNQLLLGRSLNILPDDSGITEQLPITARYRIVHHVTSQFWKRWSEEVSPSLVIRQKWHTKMRNLAVGDLVMVCDKGPLKAKYRIGVIDDVTTSRDGNVRSASIRYAVVKDNHTHITRINRSVQRLVLLLPKEEQCNPLTVEDDEIGSRIVKAGV